MNTLQIAVICIVGATVIVGISLGITLGRPDVENPVTAKILSNMDQTALPCEDFYQYVCGGWLAKTELPADEGFYDSFDDTKDVMYGILKNELAKQPESEQGDSSIAKAKNFYSACTDTSTIDDNGISSLKLLVDDVGGWPAAEGIVLPGWSLDQWIDMFFKFNSKANSQPFFVASVGKDEELATTYMLKADQPPLFLTSETYYLFYNNSDRNVELKAAYIKYAADLAGLYCSDVGRSEEDCDREELELAAELVYSMENDLASLSVPISHRSANDSLTFQKKTLGEFNASYPLMTGYIYKSTFRSIYPEKDITDDILINDASAPFFEKFDPWFSGPADQPCKNESTVQNLLMFRTMVTMVDGLPDKYQMARDEFNLVRYGTASREDRLDSCVFLTDQTLTFPVGRMYVDAAFSANARATAIDMMHRILTSFNDVILEEQNDWMDEQTKQAAHQKAEEAILNIGSPDLYDDTETMDQYYSSLTVTRDDFFTNLLNNQLLRYARTVENLDRLVVRSDWIRKGYDQGPAIVNAWYDPTVNSISIAAGIIAPVFFGEDQPMSINYGALGMALGHELIHGFDDTGRHYGAVGNKYDWWSTESADNFDERAQCMSNQYSGYYWNQAGSYLDGANENGENIADNGGIRISYEAFRQWQVDTGESGSGSGLEQWTAEQQFFIGYGQMWCSKYTDSEAEGYVKTDVHAPNPFRVVGPLSNFEEFGRAFECQVGDPYYPPNERQPEGRCRVW